MKTFDEKDLITWANREKAVIGNEYYFGNCLYDIKYRIKEGIYTVLTAIDNNCYNYPFHIKKDNSSGEVCCACLLPVEAVKENKTYRPCKDLRELYIVIYDDSSPDLLSNEDIIYYLVRKTIKFRFKDGETQYYECITGIVVYGNGDIGVEIDCAQHSFKELFDCYEIEINGEWLPFGVLED